MYTHLKYTTEALYSLSLVCTEVLKICKALPYKSMPLASCSYVTHVQDIESCTEHN